MDEFEHRSREVARAILERHGWNRPMAAELKEMREVVDLPYTECKRYLFEEWQNMRVPLLEKENAKLRELVRDFIDAPCTTCDCWQDEFRCWNYDGADCGLVARARELGVEV